jgi:hypothetical protein
MIHRILKAEIYGKVQHKTFSRNKGKETHGKGIRHLRLRGKVTK